MTALMKKILLSTIILLATFICNAQIVTADKEETFIVTSVEYGSMELDETEWPCRKISKSHTLFRFGDKEFKICTSTKMNDYTIFFSLTNDSAEEAVVEYTEGENGIRLIKHNGYSYTCHIPKDTVDTMPSFNGEGTSSFANWIAQNIQYPEGAKNNGISGKVVVKFVITRDGKVTDVEVVRGVTPELDAEAIRVISMSPDWIPGTVNGDNVNVSFTIPVNFELTGKLQQD